MIRRFRNWVDNLPFRFRYALRQLAYAAIAILIGLLVIYALAGLFAWVATYPAYAGYVDWIPYGQSATIAAIWIAEVPLAFLLRFLFGENRVTNIEYELNLLQTIELARNMDKEGHYKHLVLYRAKRWWPRSVLQYVVNIKRNPIEAWPITQYVMALTETDVISECNCFESVAILRQSLRDKKAVVHDEKPTRADLDI